MTRSDTTRQNTFLGEQKSSWLCPYLSNTVLYFGSFPPGLPRPSPTSGVPLCVRLTNGLGGDKKGAKGEQALCGPQALDVQYRGKT